MAVWTVHTAEWKFGFVVTETASSFPEACHAENIRNDLKGRDQQEKDS